MILLFFTRFWGGKNADFGAVKSMQKMGILPSGRGRNSAFFNQIVLYLETPNLVEYGPTGQNSPHKNGAPGIPQKRDAKLILLAHGRSTCLQSKTGTRRIWKLKFVIFSVAFFVFL